MLISDVCFFCKRFFTAFVDFIRIMLNGKHSGSSTQSGYAMNFEIDSGYFAARILGIISPNSKIMNVMTTVCSTITSTVLSMLAKILSDRNAVIITIAMLMKLLATNIVASSFSGFPSSFAISFPFAVLALRIFSLSPAESPKKPVSLAETSPEHTSRNITTIIPIMVDWL
jgi:hypothetical protein